MASESKTAVVGYGMNTYFWAFIVSGMLFTLGGAFSLREALRRLLGPAFFVLAGASSSRRGRSASGGIHSPPRATAYH
jgi:hypothetical protein